MNDGDSRRFETPRDPFADALGIDAWWTDAAVPLKVKRMNHYLPVSHEQIVDHDPSHVCDETCPPPYVPPKRTLRGRLRLLWYRVTRIGGYRLVHKDDVEVRGDNE